MKTKTARVRNLQYALFLFVIFNFLAAGKVRDPEVMLNEAKGLFQQNKFDAAIDMLQQFQQAHPYDYLMRDSFFLLGEIERKRENFFSAISYYDKLNSRFPHSRFRIETLYLIGQCYHKMKLYQRSELLFLEYLEKERRPDASIAYRINSVLYLSEIMREKRSFQRLEQYLQQARVLLEKDLKERKSEISKKMLQQVYYDLGILYADHLTNNEQAYYYLNKSITTGKEISTKLKFALRDITIQRINSQNGLPENNISDIKVDGDDVYVATWGSGLIRFSRSKENFETIKLPTSQIRSLFIEDYFIYINTFDGIFIFDKRDNQVRELKNSDKNFGMAQNIYKHEDKVMFTTLSSGVVEFNTKDKSVQILGRDSFLKTDLVYCITANSDVIVYGTLDKGVVIYDKKNQTSKIIDKTSGLIKGDNIKTLLIDGRFLWIGVHREGVYRYDLQAASIEHFNWGVTYPTTINRRENEIWVGSSGAGIRIFDKKTETVKKFTVIDGLAANEISRIEMEGNYIWVGYLEYGVDVIYKPLENTLGEQR